MKVETYLNGNLEEMLLAIPAGKKRELAAIKLDRVMGHPHIPTEGFENSPVPARRLQVIMSGHARKNTVEAVAQSLVDHHEALNNVYTAKVLEHLHCLFGNLPELDENTGNMFVGDVLAKMRELLKIDDNEVIIPSPDSAFDFCCRGDAYLRKGRYERAIEDYTELIKLAPEFAPAYRSRGIAYQQLYKKELAMQDLGKALNIDPDDELAKSELEKMKPKVYNIEEFQNNLDSLGKSLGESLFKIMARKNPVTVKYINGELTEKAAIDELISSGFSGEEAVTFMADIRKCYGV